MTVLEAFISIRTLFPISSWSYSISLRPKDCQIPCRKSHVKDFFPVTSCSALVFRLCTLSDSRGFSYKTKTWFCESVIQVVNWKVAQAVMKARGVLYCLLPITITYISWSCSSWHDTAEYCDQWSDNANSHEALFIFCSVKIFKAHPSSSISWCFCLFKLRPFNVSPNIKLPVP